MVSSYLRMRCPVEEAMARYGRWIGAPELGPPRLVRERDKLDLALADGNWLGWRSTSSPPARGRCSRSSRVVSPCGRPRTG